MANASTYLHRTFTAGNQRKFTGSVWFKRARLTSGYEKIMQGRDGSDSYDTSISFDPTDHIRFESWHNGAYTGGRRHTTRVFRDIAAWTHLVFVEDSENATAEDRMQIWINGVRETSFSTNVACTQDTDFYINKAGATNYIGSHSGSTDANCFTGQFAHYHFCDGQAYSASDFGEFDSTSGIWVAKTSPSVTYGENGFFLKFASGASGTDSSGEGNNMTVVGTLTNNKDNPDNNFCTANPLDNYYTDYTFSNGNCTWTKANTAETFTTATVYLSSGLWYFEQEVTDNGVNDNMQVGIASVVSLTGGAGSYLGYPANTYGYNGGGGQVYNGTSGGTFGNLSTYTTGDIIGVYLDLNANKIYFGKNGTIQNSGTGYDITAAASTASGFYSPAFGSNSGASETKIFSLNFGNGYFGTTAISGAVADAGGEGQFKYNPSTGTFDGSSKDFRAICTKNIATYG